MKKEHIMRQQISKDKKEKIQNNKQNLNVNSIVGINPKIVFDFPFSQNKDKLWIIIFERKYDDDNKSNNNKVSVKINSNDLFSNAISKYITNSRDNTDIIKFSFKGKLLNPSLPLITNGSSNNPTTTAEDIEKKKINIFSKNPSGHAIFLIFEMQASRNIIIIQAEPDELVIEVISRFLITIGGDTDEFKFIFNNKILYGEMKISQSGLSDGSKILVISKKQITGAGFCMDYKEINIKFILISENINTNNNPNLELKGLLKLCLLKEISLNTNIDHKYVFELPPLISYILQTLRNGTIKGPYNKIIIEVLEKLEGSNIINFSKFIDASINIEQLNKIMKYLNENDLKIINEIKFRLSKYNDLIELFNEEFEKLKRESIFEFSIISLVIMEREDFQKFEKEREKCPNREDKILFHGTSIEPISCILTGVFNKSVDRCYQHGKGVYFTDFLDYCWFYGGDVSNRANKNKIPKVGDNFTLIVCSIYYNRKGFRKVTDYKYTPKKNEINFAYAGPKFETLVKPDFSKFVGTEYVIWDLDQICPFMSAKLERNEFCVIWRDNNFSDKPVYKNKFDAIFKKFLKERIKYINQAAKYNIYTCQTSEEALKLVERKKYNKIILISNIGTDFGGKEFVAKARAIIGNDVIVLFLAYNIAHLKWVKNFKNALFSNEPKFYEDYLECFNDSKKVEENIKNLIDQMEKHYKIKFNFDDNFLTFPYYKEEGKYSDLTFIN